MPTSAPKPAPPPAAKPAPTPASSPVPDGWYIYHRLEFDKSLSSTQTIEGCACSATGIELTTGPLIVQPDPAAIRAAIELLDEIIVGHILAVINAASAAPEPAPVQLQQPAAVQAAPPVAPPPAAAEPSPDGAATPEQIAEVQAAIKALTPEWQTYVLETFRIEFNLPANQKLATCIKSVRHVEFILGMLPS